MENTDVRFSRLFVCSDKIPRTRRSLGTHLSILTLACGLALAVAGEATAATVLTTDFESGVPATFSGAGSLTGTQGYSSFGFGGNFLWNTTSGATVLSLSGLPAHTSLTLAFDLAFIDSWDGSTFIAGAAPVDTFTIRVDGVTLFSETFDNFFQCDQSAPTANTITHGTQLGFTGAVFGNISLCDGTPIVGLIDYWDSAYDFSDPVLGLTNLPHTSSSVTVEFFAGGSGWQGGADESWAIDNVRVDIDTASEPVPEPATWMFGAIGLGTILVRRLRQQRHPPDLTSPASLHKTRRNRGSSPIHRTDRT